MKRTRAVAAYLVLSALAVPSAWAVPPEPAPTAANVPTGAPTIAPRAGVPGLLPDPDPHPSTAPAEAGGGRERGMPGRTDSTARPTRADRDALLARVAPFGIVPVVDVSGVPALTVDHELVLSGGPEGIAAMRAAGIEVVPGMRPGVSAVRSGGRTVAWYVENPPPAASATPAPAGTSAGTPAETPAGTATPGPRTTPDEPPAAGLPKTGLRATAQLVALGVLLVAGGTAFVRVAARRRRGRS
ncbi:hypothetical protein [Yinghuangia sp. YIM S09857]|uniref:hypothetical protein n=1 Tax=Yinghuangia sp. YIM S09857 TaxID=3436929 RepID=UPI003F52A5D1